MAFIVFKVIAAVELVTGVIVVTFQYKSIGGVGIHKVFDCLVMSFSQLEGWMACDKFGQGMTSTRYSKKLAGASRSCNGL